MTAQIAIVIAALPIVSEAERQRDKAERYERALNEIAYEHPADPTRVARVAIGDES